MGAFSPNSAASFLFLRVLELGIRIGFTDPRVRACLERNFGAMTVPEESHRADLEYSIGSAGNEFEVARLGKPVVRVSGLGNLIHSLEKDLIVELQKRRPDLFFLHAAALELDGQAVLLAADAGCGKSTTTWALLHHGFRYLSDELAPVAPGDLQVFAYPHALCLKKAPPSPYVLPAAAMQLGRTIHVPVPSLPARLAHSPLPLGAVFLIRHDPELVAPKMRELGTAEAGARLYVTALNALAHAERGLAPVLRIAASVPCFALATADLGQTSTLIRSTIERDKTCSSSNY